MDDKTRAVVAHAQNDMSAQMANEAAQAPMSRLEAFGDWIKDNHAQQPTLSSEVKAMAREAVKDIRQTMNEVFFSKPEHGPEMGTPLNPTPQIITQDMGEAFNPGTYIQGFSQDHGRGMER